MSAQHPAAGTAIPGRRIDELDAARGVAMLFVCLSHSAWSIETTRPQLAEWLYIVGMVATPSFLLLSGLMLALLWYTRPALRLRLQETLLNRALFMLLVGHFIIGFAGMGAYDSPWVSLFQVTYATDAIAVAIMIGPIALSKLRSGWLLPVAAALFIASWALNLEIRPGSLPGEAAKEILVGGTPGALHVLYHSSSLLQYVAIYLGGCGLGAQLATRSEPSIRARNYSFRLAAAGIGGVLAAVVIHYAALWFAGDSLSLAVVRLLSPYQKLPPGPVHVLFYGGLALIATAAVFAAGRELRNWGLLGPLRTLGRASLFTFMFQFIVYYGLQYAAPVLPPSYWPAYFGLSLLLILFAAWCWLAVNGNRFLSFGVSLGSHDGSTVTAEKAVRNESTDL